jgi:hypothetical protein
MRVDEMVRYLHKFKTLIRRHKMKFKNVLTDDDLETDVFENVQILFRSGKLLVGFQNDEDWEICRELMGGHHFVYQNGIMFQLCNFSENR